MAKAVGIAPSSVHALEGTWPSLRWVKRYEHDDFRRQVPDNERARYVEWL